MKQAVRISEVAQLRILKVVTVLIQIQARKVNELPRKLTKRRGRVSFVASKVTSKLIIDLSEKLSSINIQV